MEDKHKRISRPQLEIWLNDQVTKTYFQCINWSSEQLRESVGLGGWRDPANNDLSSNNLSQVLGEVDGLISAIDILSHLSKHQMIDVPKEE